MKLFLFFETEEVKIDAPSKPTAHPDLRSEQRRPELARAMMICTRRQSASSL
jgi:hypothetical protein